MKLGGFGQVDEIAKAVLFLASDRLAYILAENILVDGYDGGMAII